MNAGDQGDYVVLIIDDEDMVRNIGCRILSRLGYVPISAASGKEAVLHCRHGDPVPDCLLVDFSMPGLNGAETLAEIREFMPAIPAILATGYTLDALGIDGSANVWDGVISKPFRVESLAAALEKVRGKP